MTGQVINLNKVRKATQKARRQATAQENAVKFGRSKAQKSLETARSEKAERDLDGKKSDP